MGKKIENLGILRDKVLLFGGVYSNLQALQKLRHIAQTQNIAPQQCICTGDIVGYCAQPEETVQYIKWWGAKSILGNVEVQLRDGAAGCGCDFREGSRCDGFSQQWYPYAQSKLSKNSLAYIAALPDHLQFKYAGKQVAVVHGSYFNISEFIYKSTPWERKAPNFAATGGQVIVAGHCGLPFQHKKENKLWLNPGVIGMPANDGQPHVWYAVLGDTAGKLKYTFHTMHYDYKLTGKLMQNGLLPAEYARTLS
ncbi:MAG: metallophosphoesterase family protein, partial [Marinirhabdus sp.]